MNTSKKLRGIIVPLLTPMKNPDEIDSSATKRLVDHVIQGGVNGIFVLGSTGEGPALSSIEQQKMIESVLEYTAHRVPVLIGISSASGSETLKLGKFSKAAGADAIVAAPPCYLPAEQENELIYYYERLTGEIGLPLYLYNMPALTKVKIPLDLVEKLVEIPGIVGYKDSTGDLDAFKESIRRFGGRENLSLLIGPEALTLEALRLGGDGGVNGGANLKPELFARLFRSFSEGNISEQDAAQKEILELQKLYSAVPTTPKVIRALKRELAKRGILHNIISFPALPSEEA